MVGSSVCVMGDGGRDEQEPLDADGTERADGVDGVDAPGAAADAAEVVADVVPEFAAAALAVVRDGLAVLVGVRHAALSAGELRALSREITALQGSLASAGFRTLAAMDARDDVVPKARAGQASIAFQQHALGVDHGTARRDSTTAQLLDPDTGDLKVIGAAYAAGRCCAGTWTSRSAPTATSAKRMREELIPVEGEGGWVRRIEAVDALLAEKSRAWGVRELDRLARALVEELNPKTPAGAHERRFLYASPDANGNLVGKFACAATQGALILAVLAAGNAPRPGLAIDPHGVERVLPDTRDLGQRNLDALTDCLALGAARAGIPLPAGAGTRPDPEPWPDTFGQHDESDESEDVEPEDVEPGDVEPEAEGEYTVVREPGVLSGPYPPVKILVTVGVDQFAAALAEGCGAGERPERRVELRRAVHQAVGAAAADTTATQRDRGPVGGAGVDPARRAPTRRHPRGAVRPGPAATGAAHPRRRRPGDGPHRPVGHAAAEGRPDRQRRRLRHPRLRRARRTLPGAPRHPLGRRRPHRRPRT